MTTSLTPASLVMVLSLLVTCVSASTWVYESEQIGLDPKHWGDMEGWEVCRTGKKQSPINIKSSNTVRRDLPRLHFHKYDKHFKVVDIQNNGHSLMVSPLNQHQSISGASLPNSYNFEQLHFHWGNNSNEGSEHEIDGKRYPLEMHLVHYNSKYKSASEAVKDNKRDGLAVISVLFEISKHDNEDLEPIIKKTQVVSQREGEEVVTGSGLGGVSLDDLLPKKADKKFFTYSGSLTTPPCAEVVTWFVLKKKSTISERQINIFRDLHISQGILFENFRPLQNLNNRVILDNHD